MKNLVASLCLFVVLCATASAQNPVFLPDPSATYIGSFPVQVGFTIGTDGTPILTKTESKGQCIIAFGGFRQSNGTVSFQAITPSAQFYGDGNVIDDVPTATLYGWLAEESVSEGLRRGMISYPTACYNQRVFADACVLRNGTGLTTRFSVCNTDGLFSMWQFNVSQPSGQSTPAIVLNQMVHLGDCTLPCVSTIATQNQGGSQIQ